MSGLGGQGPDGSRPGAASIGRNVRSARGSERIECPGRLGGSLRSRLCVRHGRTECPWLSGMSMYPAAPCPAAACAVGFAVVGRLKSQLTLCKLVSAPRGCRVGVRGSQRQARESKGLALECSGAGGHSLSNPA